MEENSVHLLKNGRTLGSRYVIEGVLGEGGFGITYRGHDKTLDVEVAIKEYYPQGFVTRNTTYSEELTVSQSKYTEMFQKGKEKFLSEARTLARFNRQEGVVSVTDFFETNNTAYIVMEFLDGITLKQYIDTQGLLTPAEILDLMAPLMEALDEVHNVGLIHRDISPDNIMLLENGGVKLMDFGAARAYTEFGEKSLSIVLKHGYAPEEQYRTHGVPGAVDGYLCPLCDNVQMYYRHYSSRIFTENARRYAAKAITAWHSDSAVGRIRINERYGRFPKRSLPKYCRVL